MDIHFTRMQEVGKSYKIMPHTQFALQELIKLRKRNWVPRNQVVTPITTSWIHEEAEDEVASHTPTTFMALGEDPEAMPETDSKLGQPSSKRTETDLGAGSTCNPQRRKLHLLPRWEPVQEENEANGGSMDQLEDEDGDDALLALHEADEYYVG